MEQYARLYFHQGLAFDKGEVSRYLNAQHSAQSTVLDSPGPGLSPGYTEPQGKALPPNAVGVSRSAIRNLTGYSYHVQKEWHPSPVYVEWQHKLLEDDRDVIVVDGSRQMGKSYTIAQKLIEISHIPDSDCLVGAFQAKTTNVIRNYVLRLIRKFPKNSFEHKKQDGYILNTKTLTRIHFRTLADDAQNILGLTLAHVIVDEAQLIPDSVFEESLVPTLTTTGGQLIMIGTPSRNKGGYMYKTIMDIKRGELSPEEAAYYKVSADQNPFIHPKRRAWIEKHRDEPSVRRQYFNEWGDAGDSLFSLPEAEFVPNVDFSRSIGVLAIDPARIKDRSGWSLHILTPNRVTVLVSGFVPDTHKKDWNRQAEFFTELIAKYTRNIRDPQLFVVMDTTGVGDGVATIFRNAGIKIDMLIRYTAGLSAENQQRNSAVIHVSKALLINNFLDMCQENVMCAVKPTNSYLYEELDHVTEGSGRFGEKTMVSDFFDDIINSALIAAYFVKNRGLLGRMDQREDSPYRSSGLDVVDAIESSREDPYVPASSSVW